MNDMYLRVGR